MQVLSKSKTGKNKKEKINWPRIFLVEGWSIEGHVTKVIEQTVLDFGLLFLH